jgi:hypothetical protein
MNYGSISRHWLRRAFLALPLAVLLAVVATPAEARSKHRNDHRDHGHHQARHHHDRHGHPGHHGHHGPVAHHHPAPYHGHGWVRNGYAPAHFVVPTVIEMHGRGYWEPWYRGYAYDRGHHHDHAVYDFPVLSGGVWISQPHAYCGGALFSGHVVYERPHLSVGIGFGF